MRISSIFFAALATAAPASNAASETITVTDFFVREDWTADSKVIHAVGFKLTGTNATNLDCHASEPAFPNPTEVTNCGDSKYRFSLHQGSGGADFALRIYHELGLAVGYWGQGNVPTYCHAGGDGPADFVCQQVIGPATIVIDSTPPPVDP